MEPTKLIEFLAPYPPAVQAATLAARLRLIEIIGPSNEIFWDATQAVCSGFCFTHNTSDNFINLAVYPKHVTLIFPWGARLEDPEGRLRGDGSRVRNLRLTEPGMLEDPYFLRLIEDSIAMAKRPPAPLELIQIVKVMRGPKKRP